MHPMRAPFRVIAARLAEKPIASSVRLGATLLAALLLAGAPAPANSQLMMSEAEEVAVGKREDQKVRREYGVYDNAQLQQYVNGIGQRLARASDRAGLQYHFVVLDTPEVNAFALPGGYIYMTRGILAYLNSEAELAAVLGHELGHVTARHSVRQSTASTAAGIGASIIQILVPQARGVIGDTAINVLGSALLSGYGREHELEADRLGAEYLARVGYDPQAMVRVIGVLKNQELFDAEVAKAEGRQPRAYHGLFSSHPDNDTRLQQVVGEASRQERSGTLVAPEEFLRKIDGMVYAGDSRQGIVRGSLFAHAGLGIAFDFPPGWKVQNRSQNVAALSPQGDALIDLRAAGSAQGTPGDVIRRYVKLPAAVITPVVLSGLPAAAVDT